MISTWEKASRPASAVSSNREASSAIRARLAPQSSSIGSARPPRTTPIGFMRKSMAARPQAAPDRGFGQTPKPEIGRLKIPNPSGCSGPPTRLKSHHAQAKGVGDHAHRGERHGAGRDLQAGQSVDQRKDPVVSSGRNPLLRASPTPTKRDMTPKYQSHISSLFGGEAVEGAPAGSTRPPDSPGDGLRHPAPTPPRIRGLAVVFRCSLKPGRMVHSSPMRPRRFCRHPLRGPRRTLPR